MKRTISITAFFFAGFLISCEKNTSSVETAEMAALNNNQRTMCINPDAKQVDCDKTYAPVCACNSVTYANVCEAQNAGLLKWVKGTCEENGGGYPGDGPNVK